MGKTLGERIKDRRKTLGFSQEKLAEELFITQATLSKYENDVGDIPSGALLNLASALNTTPNYLLLGDEVEDGFISNLISAGKKLRTSCGRKMAINQIEALADLEDELSNIPNLYK